MISIHTSCRLEQYAYITNTEKQSCRSCCGKFIIHSTICTCRVALNGTNTDIFHYGNCQSLCMLLKKKVICMMNICHLQMNRDKINSRGESTDFVDSKPDLHTRHFAYSHCPPLSLQQNAIWNRGRGSQQVCIESSTKYTLMYTPLLTTNTSTFTSRDRGEVQV